jgi:hypothetical protein
MGYIAYLKRGAKTLRLDEAPFEVDAESFVPPATQEEPLLAFGTSANRYGGSNKVSERAFDVEFNLPVVVTGRSEAAVRLNGQQLAAFLESGTKADPVFFCWKGNDDVSVEPLWGQYGAPVRYEIIHAGTPQVDDFYRMGDQRKYAAGYNATLRVKPYAQGLPQRFGSAAGGIVEDNFGTADGRSRGLIIPEAITNKFTNSVFGHSTWNNGWTAGSSLTATENNDPEFVLPGTRASATLFSNSTSNNTFTQSINVGNTNTHCLSVYAKRHDGGAIDSNPTEFWLYYNNQKPSYTYTYQAIGNGWYRVSVTVTGINSAVNTGVQVVNGQSITVAGFQLEQLEYPTPLCYGDLLGCAWSGTAHASTSTRTVARWRIPAPTLLSTNAGTLRVVVKMSQADDRPLDATYFHDTIGGMIFGFNSGAATFFFTDGTNTATSSAQSFDQGDVLIFHCVYSTGLFGSGGLQIYRDGTEIASDNTYTPREFGDYFYLGTTEVGGFPGNDTFSDFAIFDRALTAGEILADATNISAFVNGGDGLGQCLSPIPWLWTDDGDDVLEGCDDNWCVIGGIPGNTPSSRLQFAASYSTQLSNARTFWLDNLPLEQFVSPMDNKFYDLSGVAEAGTCGGEAVAANVGSSEGVVGNAQVARPDLLRGRDIQVIARMRDIGTAVWVKFRQGLGNDGLDTDFKPLTTDTTYRLYEIGRSYFASPAKMMDGVIEEVLGGASNTVKIVARRDSGSPALYIDYLALLFNAMKLVDRVGNNITIFYDNGKAVTSSSTSLPLTFNGNSVEVYGRSLELHPHKYNIINWYPGDNTTAPAITVTWTFRGIWITPLWSIH